MFNCIYQEHFIFFSPVFNFADASISVGVILLILFCRTELASISFSSTKDEGPEDVKERNDEGELNC